MIEAEGYSMVVRYWNGVSKSSSRQESFFGHTKTECYKSMESKRISRGTVEAEGYSMIVRCDNKNCGLPNRQESFFGDTKMECYREMKEEGWRQKKGKLLDCPRCVQREYTEKQKKTTY